MAREELARSPSWTDRLHENAVSAVIVEGGGRALRSLDAWDNATPGDTRLIVENGAASNPEGLCRVLSEENAQAVAPFVVDLARDYCRALETAGHEVGPVRVRVTVSEGLNTAPCPRVHTDNVLLRCLVAVRGPPTVVVTTRGPFAGDDIVSPREGDALLLKGRLWPSSSPARHRSPLPIDGRRVILSLDRLQDILG